MGVRRLFAGEGKIFLWYGKSILFAIKNHLEIPFSFKKKVENILFGPAKGVRAPPMLTPMHIYVDKKSGIADKIKKWLFYQCFMISFFEGRSQKSKKTVKSTMPFCAFGICTHKSCSWNVGEISLRCQFHQCSTSSFCFRRSKKSKKDGQLDCLFFIPLLLIFWDFWQEASSHRTHQFGASTGLPTYADNV